MDDLHEISFVWPDTGPQDVILTGSFDQWAGSMHLTKYPSGFEGTVKVPWGTRVFYKFIVDGKWMTLPSQPEEPDNLGNLNNIYISPSKPKETAIPMDEATMEPVISEDSHTANVLYVPQDTKSTPPIAGENDPIVENIPEEPLVLVPSEHLPNPEASISNDPPLVEPTLLPLDGLPSTTAIESAVLPNPEKPILLSKSSQLSDTRNEVLPPVASKYGQISSNGTSEVVEFPKSEASDTTKPTSIRDSSSPVTDSSQQKSEKPVSPESDPKALSPSPSTPSTPSHLRETFESRQRSVSSRSNSVRSESKRSKRHSLFGKVKHLFHLDKDS